ncbi:MAG: hypothetical protein ACRD5G_02840 [Candidatus Acidiferrales bacterium]
MTRKRRHFAAALLAGALLVFPFTLAAAGIEAGGGSQEDKAGKKEAEKSITDLRIEVTAGDKSEPVDQASVYVKYMEERALRRDKKVELNLKTNREGVARLSDAPRGKVLIQVVAPGWKTFGKWFDLDQDQQTIKIRLEKPPRWY